MNNKYKKYKKLPYNPKLKEKAKALRKAGNLSEALLWLPLKKKNLLGLDFHRQKIIGNYIVDFYCPELQLVVEIDGVSHDFKIEYDERREKYLESLDLTIIHYSDIDVKRNMSGVIDDLIDRCEKLMWRGARFE